MYAGSHGLCPECLAKYRVDIAQAKAKMANYQNVPKTTNSVDDTVKGEDE